MEVNSKKVLILGDSHTRALTMANELRKNSVILSDIQFDINWLLTEKGDKKRGDMKIDDAINQASILLPDDLVALSIIGTSHNILGLIQHQIPFNLMSSDDEIFIDNDGVLIITENAMYDMFEYIIRRNTSIQKISKVCKCNVLHISTPPPKENDVFIKEHTKRYREKLVSDIGLTPAPLRLKLWKLEMRVLQNQCAEWGLGFLPAPDVALDNNGFLKHEYYANDATHANTAYGELVLRQLEQIVLNYLPSGETLV